MSRDWTKPPPCVGCGKKKRPEWINGLGRRKYGSKAKDERNRFIYRNKMLG